MFEKLINLEKLSEEIEVLDIGGKTFIKDSLDLVQVDPFYKDEVKAIGITRDADEDAENAVRQVCNALQSAGLPVPDEELKPTNTNPKIVALILPGNGKKGMLEDLCLASVIKDPAMECLENYFECLVEKKVNLSEGTSRSKFKVQAFLASRKDTDMHLGRAAEKGHWLMESDCFNIIRVFFKLLL